jgi:hypothetical protein
MANLKPAHGNISTVEYPLTTASTTKGYPLCYLSGEGDAGYLAPAIPTSAVGIIAVSAETKNGLTERSALASVGDGSGNNVVLAWPANAANQFLAVCSSTPVIAMLDVAWNVSATGVIQNETTAESQFIIERIVDATAKTVIGRFTSGHYTARVGGTHAVGS